MKKGRRQTADGRRQTGGRKKGEGMLVDYGQLEYIFLHSIYKSIAPIK
ncbi:MAG: hypothetical protein V1779_00335 [bacterium]